MLQFKVMIGYQHFIVEATGAEMEAFLGLAKKMVSGSQEHLNAETLFVRDYPSKDAIQSVELCWPSMAVVFEDERDERAAQRLQAIKEVVQAPVRDDDIPF